MLQFYDNLILPSKYALKFIHIFTLSNFVAMVFSTISLEDFFIMIPKLSTTIVSNNGRQAGSQLQIQF